MYGIYEQYNPSDLQKLLHQSITIIKIIYTTTQ